METAIGIDLGTTFSAVSVIDEYGKPVIVKNVLEENLTPSVIYFNPDGRIIIGTEAKDEQKDGEKNIASFFKRNMGDTNFQLNFHGKIYTATELSGLLLKKLKEDAEIVLKKTIKKAVITVPAYFNDLQKKATIKAAEFAGLEVLRIINEPTAAAIAFGVTQTKNQTILVFDLGGGTFDVTILKIANSAIQVIATGGDHELGGKDWDNRLIGYFANQFIEEFGVDPLADSISYNDLLIKAENAKKQLSTLQNSKFSFAFDGNKSTYEISRNKFEEITQDLLQKTTSKAEEVLKEANLSWKGLDGVLLVGGSTRMPMVVNWVEQMSGNLPLKGINVDEAICLGAAIQANIELNNTGSGKTFTLGDKISSIEDVMSHSLGLIAENSNRSKYINSIIIPKNKGVPASEVRPYQIRTGRTIKNELEIYLTQGETEVIGECKIIGKYVFSNIEFVPGGMSVIDVEYKYNENGIVQIAAIQRETVRKLSMTEVDLPSDMSWIDREPVKEKFVIPHLSVVIAVDLSGSMSGNPLEEAQKAAIGFVEKLDLTNTSVALMPFADGVKINQELTQNAKKLISGVNNWSDLMDKGTVGYGNSTHPFDEALKMLKEQDDPKFIVVLTDGCWSYQDRAIQSAKKCAEDGIEVIAIGFGGADKKFLQAIATSDENALFTNLEGLVTSFSKIAQVLTETSGNFSCNNQSGKKKGFLGFIK
ncbi:MAG: Hsp70 family protein [Bacteroidales bacterium]